MVSLKGTGPELQPGSTRRPRLNVTYNIKALTYQTRAPSEPNLKKSQPRDSTPGSRPLHHASAQSTNKARKWITPKHQAQPERRRVEGLLKKYKKPPERALKRASGVDDDDDDDDDDDENVSPASPRRAEEGNAGVFEVGAFVQRLAQTESKPKKAEISTQIEYILQTLRKAGEPTPGRVIRSIVSSALNFKLLTFPQQRNIEWATGRSKAWKFSKDIDVTALLMQMTGETAQTPCTRCVDGRGQWKNCVLIPPGTDYTRIYGCANCVYHGKQTYCSYKLWGRKGPKKPASGHVQEHKETVRDFHQGRISVPEVERMIEEDEPPAANDADPVGSKQALSHQVDGRRRSTRPSAANSREATGVEETVTSLVAVGRPGELLSMEPWERAPGQIRSHIPDKAESELPRLLVEG